MSPARQHYDVDFVSKGAAPGKLRADRESCRIMEQVEGMKMNKQKLEAVDNLMTISKAVPKELMTSCL